MIRYKSGYKYVLHQDYTVETGIVSYNVETKYLSLNNGKLTIRAGYAWDGPSGPALDTKNFMRASLVHDALYQLIKETTIPSWYIDQADLIMKDICLEDGMSRFRAWYSYHAVRIFGKLVMKRTTTVHRAP